jgi:hypothetical protein
MPVIPATINPPITASTMFEISKPVSPSATPAPASERHGMDSLPPQLAE